jgi:hypothetical protein
LALLDDSEFQLLENHVYISRLMVFYDISIYEILAFPPKTIMEKSCEGHVIEILARSWAETHHVPEWVTASTGVVEVLVRAGVFSTRVLWN